MKTGVVIWFDHQKGYGFIQSDEDINKQYFVHYTGIISDDKFKTLTGDARVEFSVEIEPGGRERAVEVKRVN